MINKKDIENTIFFIDKYIEKIKKEKERFDRLLDYFNDDYKLSSKLSYIADRSDMLIEYLKDCKDDLLEKKGE